MATEKQKPKQDPEAARLKKEERARASRRRSRQLIGFALTVLIVVGAVSIVMAGINLVNSWMDVSDEKDDYQTLFEPLVWFDIVPFNSVSTLEENAVKQVAIWGVWNQYRKNDEEIARNSYGEALVSADEVNRYGVDLFGPNFRFSGHATFTDTIQGLRYTFDEENQQYVMPNTGLNMEFYATIVDIVQEGGGVRRVVVGYVNARGDNNQMMAQPDFNNPTRYMDYMLRRDGSGYYLYAIQPNTTHVPQVTPPASLPPEDGGDSSLPGDDAA